MLCFFNINRKFSVQFSFVIRCMVMFCCKVYQDMYPVISTEILVERTGSGMLS